MNAMAALNHCLAGENHWEPFYDTCQICIIGVNISKFLPFFKAVLALFLFAMAVSYAQDKCVSCGERISGEYIVAEGKAFHKAHFKCDICGKRIESNYVYTGSAFRHPECDAKESGFVCAHCGKVITGEYVTQNGSNYHPECFQTSVQKKCAVCRLPLTGEYQIDAFGNEFHPHHSNEYKNCVSCNRLVCEPLTRGGKRYADGRTICNLCYPKAVFDNYSISTQYNSVLGYLRGAGFQINSAALRVIGTDRTQLESKAGADYSEQMQGFTDIHTKKQYVNGRETSASASYTVYVLNGLPSATIGGIIAHELMHVWLHQNTSGRHSSSLKEGSCNFVAYLYLKSVGSQDALFQITKMELDSDPDYGKGFLRVREKFGGQSVSVFLDYLKKKSGW